MSEDKERGSRICVMTNGLHDDVTKLYEQLVDRDYSSAKQNIKQLMKDLRDTIKLIEEDDF